LEDRRISAKLIAEQLGISRERVGSIIHEDLDVRKVTKGVLFLHDNVPVHRPLATLLWNDSSGRAISPSQRPLLDNTQHPQETNTHDSGGIQTHNLSKRVSTVIGHNFIYVTEFSFHKSNSTLSRSKNSVSPVFLVLDTASLRNLLESS
jgi:hypothetical protein